MRRRLSVKEEICVVLTGKVGKKDHMRLPGAGNFCSRAGEDGSLVVKSSGHEASISNPVGDNFQLKTISKLN